jgi:predicted nucleotidyltransferase component of viral defense system
MLDLSQIEQHYPKYLRQFKRNILREYLQYKILEIVFTSKLSSKLSFMGGTALRIMHKNSRFSEDLDFDNFGLNKNEFENLSIEIEKGLNRQGFDVEKRNVFKDAFHCHIKFNRLLFENKLSNLESEKILIQIDTEPQNFKYKPERIILNEFDVFTLIFLTPADILLSQKIFAVLNRKRPKGRDFFDVIFLLQNTKPNYNYLNQMININNGDDLKNKLISFSKNLNFKNIIKDVEPFLFDPENSRKIELFPDYIKQVKF